MGQEGEIEKRRRYCESTLSKFRDDLKQIELPGNCAVVVNGSFARREASDQSDVDYFVLHDDGPVSSNELQRLNQLVVQTIERHGLRPPAVNGAFAAAESIDQFLHNVGGANDPNEKLTRRMLFMLEGEWLTQRDLFLNFRSRLINEVYAKQDLSDHQLARFFLNDLIRYWRTIGVDFEFKTAEAGKPWGTRNLKLAFSRKLLYFSGLLMTAETAQQTVTGKARVLAELSALDPISRVKKICGQEANKALAIYEEFLEKLSDKAFRALADSVDQDRKRQPEEFRDLKNRGQYFSWELDRLLHMAYGPGHPIHHALIF